MSVPKKFMGTFHFPRSKQDRVAAQHQIGFGKFRRPVRLGCLFFVVVMVLPSMAAAQSSRSNEIHPVLMYHDLGRGAAGALVLGGAKENGWAGAEEIRKIWPLPNRRFRFFNKSGGGKFLGKMKLTEKLGTSDICENIPVIPLPKALEKMMVATSAPWNPLPRRFKRLSTRSKIYRKHAREAAGSAKVSLVELIRVDLEGDGVNEVLMKVVSGHYVETDSYTGILYNVSLYLRRVVKGRVSTTKLGGSDGGPPSLMSDFPSVSEMLDFMLLDLNGDGKMEIIIQTSDGARVLDISGGKPKTVLENDCPPF